MSTTSARVPSLDDYLIQQLVGEGSFGKVFKGRRRYCGQLVAIKFIPVGGRSRTELAALRKEIEILQTLQHENIVLMLDYFETASDICVVTEFAQGELFDILEDDVALSEVVVRTVAQQLVRALHYLHSHRVIHRDMKPQNVLLGAGSRVMLCDFGFARAMSQSTTVLTSIKGTPLYMSPELVQELPYDHRVDLWSLGVIVFELFTGTPPFYTNNIYSLISLIVHGKVCYPAHMSATFRSFLSGLLNKRAERRLAWPELLQHAFISGVVVPGQNLHPVGHALRLRSENYNLFLSVLPLSDSRKVGKSQEQDTWVRNVSEDRGSGQRHKGVAIFTTRGAECFDTSDTALGSEPGLRAGPWML